MAFPGTYNFNYVRGDTLEFKVYPKTTSGANFDLTDYYAYFSVAPLKTSPESDVIQCLATISGDHIDCVIEPADGEVFPADATEMVYQVYIYKSSGAYEQLYTILEGTITVSQNIFRSVLGES